MASNCNDEHGPFGVMSGHDRNTLSLSVAGDGASDEKSHLSPPHASGDFAFGAVELSLLDHVHGLDARDEAARITSSG